MMSGIYDVYVWETETLYNWEGTTPAERTKTYLEGAFNKISGWDVSVTIINDYPQMYLDDEDESNHKYEQHVLDGNSTTIPCKSTSTTYDGIAYYFRDYIDYCSTYSPSGPTQHVLLTAAHSQAGHTVHYNDYSICVVEGGHMIVDAPSTFTRYEPKDDSTAAGKGIDAIQTTHHELGHAFLHDDENNHVDHEMGAATKYDGNYWWRTPMGLNGGTTNECGKSFTREKYDRWDLVWSDCCVSEWEGTPG